MLNVCVLLLLITVNVTVAWWDNGHMLVGEVARELLLKSSPETVKDLELLMATWEKDFPNTGSLSSATIWADLIKCNKQRPYCASPLTPSLSMFSEWHYTSLGFQVNDPSKLNVTEVFKQMFDGRGLNVMSETLKTFETTKSTWSANLMLRFMLHVFGDIHQPCHTASAFSADFPKGDRGGNSYGFAKPCPARNIHMLWDSTNGKYPNNWNLQFTPASQEYTDLTKNASKIIEKFDGKLVDALDYQQYLKLSFSEFTEVMKKEKVFEKTLFESHVLARDVVYKKLDLTLDSDGNIKCPSKEYLNMVVKMSEERIYLAGSRLAVVLQQLVKPAKENKLVPNSC